MHCIKNANDIEEINKMPPNQTNTLKQFKTKINLFWEGMNTFE